MFADKFYQETQLPCITLYYSGQFAEHATTTKVQLHHTNTYTLSR